MLQVFVREHPDLTIVYREVDRDPAAVTELLRVFDESGVWPPGVPTFVIDGKMHVGFSDADRTGPALRALIARAAPGSPVVDTAWLGPLSASRLGLPLFTLALGLLDGFNPCAMWVLLVLLSLLVRFDDRRRMAVVAGTFVLVSGAVYYAFMAAWLNFLLFMGAVVWVRAAVALVALGGGFYYLREYFRNPDAACPVTAPQARRRVFENLRKLATESRFWLAFLGILALAFAVNLVELICSAGIPAVYTQVLALSNLPAWQYYAYLGLYILVFMLDDLFVFVVAMKTLQVAGVTADYSRFSHLAGGIARRPGHLKLFAVRVGCRSTLISGTRASGSPCWR